MVTLKEYTDVRTIHQSICTLFNDSQHNSSSHRRNVQHLKKLLLQQCSGDPVFEEQFFTSIIGCLSVLLTLKRTDETGSRLLRLLAGLIICLSGEERNEAAPRFIENVMFFCLEHIDAKDKTIRARLATLIVACMNSIDEISDELWMVFKQKMPDRLFDKESFVRVQSVHAMSRLQGLSMSNENQDSSSSPSSIEVDVLDIFIDMLQHDPSADVRRSVLSLIDVLPKSLPAILSRARDQDLSVRKSLFAKKMPSVDIRMLSIEQRDELLRTGLSDREPIVRQACAQMILGTWIQRTNSNLIEFLACLDVVTDPEVAEKALKEVFALIPDMFDHFGEPFFEHLTVEMAFVMRVFCQHKSAAAPTDLEDDSLASLLPEITILAEHVKRFYEYLVMVQDEVTRADVEFIILQLLQVLFLADYSDEAGRRILGEIVLDLLTNLDLGEPIVEWALKVLHKLSEADFVKQLAELVASFKDVYDTGAEGTDDTLSQGIHRMSLDGQNSISQDGTIRVMAQLKALELIKCALRNELVMTVQTGSSLDPTLLALLDQIVITGVNSHFASVQASALQTLGMFGCLTLELAVQYAPLMCDFFRVGDGGLELEDEKSSGSSIRMAAMQTLFDWFVLYSGKLTQEVNDADAQCASIVEVLLAALYDDQGSIQTIASEGFSKLLLHRIIKDPQVLLGLLQLHFHPCTVSLPRLRQGLSYFLSAFCLSSQEGQDMLVQVVPQFLITLAKTHGDELAEGKIGLVSAGVQLFHYCNPNNLLPHVSRNESEDSNHTVVAVFAGLGTEIVIACFVDPEVASAGLATLITKLPLFTSETDPTASFPMKPLFHALTQLLKAQPGLSSSAMKKFLASLVEAGAAEPMTLEQTQLIQARIAPYLQPQTGHIKKKNAGIASGRGRPKRTVQRDDKEDDSNFVDDLIEEFAD